MSNLNPQRDKHVKVKCPKCGYEWVYTVVLNLKVVEKVERDNVRFIYVGVDLSGLYGFNPTVTACDIYETLTDVYEEFEEVWSDVDIIIDYSPDYLDIVDGEITVGEGKALVLAIEEVRSGKTLSDALSAIKFLKEHDIDKIGKLVEKLRYVKRLYDGYGYCYLIKLRE
ncbi:MAG: hypothetical protein QXS62_07280 [Sulfolobales archaeon]